MLIEYHVSVYHGTTGELVWQFVVTAESLAQAKTTADSVAKRYADERDGKGWSASYTTRLCTLDHFLTSLRFRGQV